MTMKTGNEALTILRQNANYLDKNFVNMSDRAIAVRLREAEEAIKVLKHLMRIK